MKLFSIITINYNNLKGLQHTVNSVCAQTDLREVQWIIIDGGSGDGSAAFIEQTAQKYANEVEICWVSEKDKGIYDAMNKGLAMATGTYVWFLNSGDCIHNEWVTSKLSTAMLALPTLPDVVYGDTMFVDINHEHLGLISKQKPQPYPKKLHGGSFRFGMNICHQSFLAKRALSPNYNLMYKQASDIDWIISVLKQAKSSFNSQLIISDFEVGGSSYQHTKTAMKERYEVLSKHYGKWQNFMAHIWIFIRRGIFNLKNSVFGSSTGN